MGMILGFRDRFVPIVIITASILFQVSFFIEGVSIASAKESSPLSADDKKEDVKIKAVWNAMKASLRSGDANKALRYFSPLSTSEYKEIFNILAGDDLCAAA